MSQYTLAVHKTTAHNELLLPLATEGSVNMPQNTHERRTRVPGVVQTASILQFMPRGVFDDAATKVMGEAFDAACKALHDTGQPHVLYEVMARRIIAAARTGVRDVARLSEAALMALANSKKPIE